MKEEVGKWARMLQTELEGGRAIHNSSGQFKDIKEIFCALVAFRVVW